jgi:hypothetical protein
LLFQARRQLIALGQAGRQTFAMLRVPMAHLFPVAIPIIVAAIVAAIAIVIAIVGVSLAMPLSLAQRKTRGHCKHSYRARAKPSSRSHDASNIQN